MSKLKAGKELEASLSSSEEELEKSFVARMRLCADRVGSVSALAKKAGISQSGIRRYFDGGEPTRPHLIALAAAADVRVGWLATGEGPDDDLKHDPEDFVFGSDADNKKSSNKEKGEKLTGSGMRMLVEHEEVPIRILAESAQGPGMERESERSMSYIRRHASQQAALEGQQAQPPLAVPPPPALYAALVGPLAEHTSDPEERKWALVASVEIVMTATGGDIAAMEQLNEDDLALVVKLAMRVRGIWQARKEAEEGGIAGGSDKEDSWF